MSKSKLFYPGSLRVGLSPSYLWGLGVLSQPQFLDEVVPGAAISLSARDLTTITNVGGKASEWDCRVSGRVFAQASDPNRPTIGSGVLTFAGSQFLSLAEATGLSWTDGTIVVVSTPVDNAFFKTAFSIYDSGSAATRMQAVYNTNENFLVSVSASTLGAAATSSTLGGTQNAGIGHWADGVSLSVEDSEGGSASDVTFSGVDTTYTSLEVGRSGAGANFLTGDISDICFWPFRMNETQINSIKSFLQTTFDPTWFGGMALSGGFGSGFDLGFGGGGASPSSPFEGGFDSGFGS